MSSPHPSSARRIALTARPQSMATWFVAFATLLAVAFTTYNPIDAGAAAQTDSSGTPTVTQEDANQTVADIAEEANPWVVTVYTFVDAQSQSEQPGLGEMRPGRQQPSTQDDDAVTGEPVALGAGSGWIYTEDGYVITNAHVVSGADSFMVLYSDGTEVPATLVGADTIQDVAVLKLQLEDGQTVPGVAKVGDSSLMRAGDDVVAIGSPLGEFTNSVSDGIIGGLDRALDSGNGTTLDNLIQHDAEISSGNSGGPLLNMSGEVIGMNVAKIDTASTNGQASVSGLNFAIDGNSVVASADEIIATQGSIAYPFVGVQTQQAEEGLVVVDVLADGPAATSGIEAGDILTGVDGESVDATTSFSQLLLQHRPGDTVSINVDRQGEALSFDVTLGERPADDQA